MEILYSFLIKVRNKTKMPIFNTDAHHNIGQCYKERKSNMWYSVTWKITAKTASICR